jgi:hypothetical protein
MNKNINLRGEFMHIDFDKNEISLIKTKELFRKAREDKEFRLKFLVKNAFQMFSFIRTRRLLFASFYHKTFDLEYCLDNGDNKKYDEILKEIMDDSKYWALQFDFVDEYLSMVIKDFEIIKEDINEYNVDDLDYKELLNYQYKLHSAKQNYEEAMELFNMLDDSLEKTDSIKNIYLKNYKK